MDRTFFASQSVYDPASAGQPVDELETRWAPRWAILFVIGASATCWGAIVFAVWQIV